MGTWASRVKFVSETGLAEDYGDVELLFNLGRLANNPASSWDVALPKVLW